jgi:hypothetical protein
MSKFKYSLEVISEDNRGAVYPLNRTAIVIGSGTDADIVLQADNIAKSHCLLKQEQGRLSVIDMHSSIGTKVGNKKIISETLLSSGDILTIGPIRMRLLSATLRERLVSFLPVPEEKKQVRVISKIAGKIKGGAKAVYEKTITRSLLLMFFLSGLFLIYPLYSSFNRQLQFVSLDRATSLLKALAAVNVEAIKTSTQAMVDTSIIAKERGVKMALVMTNTGSVWAPQKLLGKKATDAYGNNAIKSDKLLIQKRDDGLLDLSMPIRYYDFKKGTFIKGGIARIIFDVNASTTSEGINWKMILALGSGAYLILVFLVGYRIKNAVKKDIYLFRDDCEQLLRADNGILEEKYSHEFNKLTVTINRLLRKKEKGKDVLPGDLETEERALVLEVVELFAQGAMALDMTNRVLGCNAAALKILDLNELVPGKKNLLEIQCKKEFFKDIIELVSSVSLSGTKSKSMLKVSEDEEISCTGVPLKNGLILVLFGNI